MATNSNITVPQNYTTKYSNLVHGWNTSHPTTISKKYIILIYHYLHAVEEGLFLKGIALKRGSDAFTQVPDRIVTINDSSSFQVKLANLTDRSIVVCAGELIGRLCRARDSLTAHEQMMPQELDEFTQRTACLAMLVLNLDAWTRLPPSDLQHSIEDHLQDPEHLGWGPKNQLFPANFLGIPAPCYCSLPQVFVPRGVCLFPARSEEQAVSPSNLNQIR